MEVTFDNWISELTAQGLELPDGICAGARENLWSLSFAAGGLPSEAELTRFVEAAVDLRKRQVESMGAKPATFYLWHDEQAGQLRFSVARCLPDSLPFRCPVTRADAANEVIRDFLTSGRSNGLVAWSELEPVAFDTSQAGDEEPHRQRVWALRLA
jgi:hypothetical protein